MKMILASGSPRRRAILEQIDVRFLICPAKGEEETKETEPAKVVEALSRKKAEEIADAIISGKLKSYGNEEIWEDQNGDPEECLVIGADTVVSFEDKILGKPKDEEDAKQMLKMLQGKTHVVYSGVTCVQIKLGFKKEVTFSEGTEVEFYPMSDDEIKTYVATGEPMDKAGAYAIQGKFAAFVRQIHGDYYNVMGLPLAHMIHSLSDWGIDLLKPEEGRKRRFGIL